MKHAFLIMAHTNWSLLKRLLKKLDFTDSRIYLNIDAKAEISEVQLEELRSSCKNAILNIVPRKSVNWGGTVKLNVNFFF